MKILFLSQIYIDLNNNGIYEDLINDLICKNHEITLVMATSQSDNKLVQNGNLTILGVKTGEQFGVNIIKKGLVMLTLERKIISAIKKNLNNFQYDLILYATPPITFANVVQYCKKKYNCKSYLMLKDIFPQNAVDIGMLSKDGLIYNIFKTKERKLYEYSDRIGCMSEANIHYLHKYNNINLNKLELFPNAVKDRPYLKTDKDYSNKFNIPKDKLIFIYGGNLGKPQGLDFLAKAIEYCENKVSAYFVIVGGGTEKEKLFKRLQSLNNVICIERLKPDEYKKLCALCDVGMVMLDYRFTIPNYPSRILSYMENAMPVFACTDMSSDIKELIEKQAKNGKWCYSNNIDLFITQVQWFIDNKQLLNELGNNGLKYLKQNFVTDICINKLEQFVKKEK